MDTKNKILASALALFNVRGVKQVSLRTISDEMGISLGNLTYHFKKREDIIEALYLQLVNTLDEVIANNPLTENPLQLLFEIPKLTLRQFYTYRFLMLDFVDITRNHDPIRKHYQKLMEVRQNQFSYLIKSLVEANLMREERVRQEYVFLFQNLRIVCDFWFSAVSVDNNSTLAEKDVLEGTALIYQILIPYLTEKGRDEAMRLGIL